MQVFSFLPQTRHSLIVFCKKDSGLLLGVPLRMVNISYLNAPLIAIFTIESKRVNDQQRPHEHIC